MHVLTGKNYFQHRIFKSRAVYEFMSWITKQLGSKADRKIVLHCIGRFLDMAVAEFYNLCLIYKTDC